VGIIEDGEIHFASKGMDKSVMLSIYVHWSAVEIDRNPRATFSTTVLVGFVLHWA